MRGTRRLAKRRKSSIHVMVGVGSTCKSPVSGYFFEHCASYPKTCHAHIARMSARGAGNFKHACAAVDDDGKENHHEPAHGREYCHNRWLRIVVNHEQEPISYGPFPGLSTIRPPYIAYSSRADARILSGLMQSVQ